jgi:LCP family protein required for cell wall assembly
VASKDKPYRLYRGGRAKGPMRLPRASTESKVALPGPSDDWGAGPTPPPETPPRRRRRRGWIVFAVLVLAIVLAIVWTVLGYLALRRGVEDANERVDARVKAALTPQDGLLLSNPSNVLLIGIDRGASPGREGRGRADSIVLVRTDPDEHRVALLSIPRDLRVEIPGHGPDKINTAFSLGGAALTIETVEGVTGLDINHVAVVDFGAFADVIDALGGVTIDVPRRIVSNRFDCPFATPAECRRWSGWRFPRGEQRLDGKRALVFSRIRENQLDPNESDITRGGRQQQVVQAIADEVVAFGSFLRLPFMGDELVKPLATDLSATELMQLGWVEFRASDSKKLRCRLGGAATQIGDGAYIVGSEENVAVVAMVEGKAAPQPPLPGAGPFGPGCLVGE